MVAFLVPFTAGPGWDYRESKDKDGNYSQVGTGGGDVPQFQWPPPIAVLLKAFASCRSPSSPGLVRLVKTSELTQLSHFTISKPKIKNLY